MSMSSNFDADIAQRIKAKGKPEQAQKLSRIEETAARLVEVKTQYNDLDRASYTARHLRNEKYSAASHIKIAMDAALHEQHTLEQALSVAKPESLVDVLITLTVSLWRLDAIRDLASEDFKDDFETDRGIVENTLERAIPVLEKHAGISLAELGLDSYFTLSKSPEELIADVAALKEENLRNLAAFTGAEPVTNPAEYELLKGKLRRIIVAWKTIEDLDAAQDEDPVRVALMAVAHTAEQEIADLPAESLAVAAAKLVIAKIAELRDDLIDQADGGWNCDQQAAQAALKAIEWFGLKELYDAYYPGAEGCAS
jgi:hypothetical protein